MRELRLEYRGATPSHIIIGNGILNNCARYIAGHKNARRAVIITDSNVGPIFATTLQKILEEDGISNSVITISAGESYKNLDTVKNIYYELSGLHADRNTIIIALAGGVIGDIAGFIASTYLRGLPLVHIPTSLVAMVDSSIGGKTGVNLDQLKNQVGSFYHARAIIIDTAMLSTLPQHEFTNGIAEIIKSAAIADSKMFEFLETNIESLLTNQTELIEEIIFRTVKIKTDIVLEDEKDTSKRQLLNFGHTIGHGIETASNFSVTHGQAVAIGMIAAARISKKMNLLTNKDYLRLKKLISRAGLPEKIDMVDPMAVIHAIEHDKKNKEGKTNFVLISSPGKGLINQEVAPEMIVASIVEQDE